MSDLPLNQILCGNCVEVLKDFPDNSIDLVVTDPPYGLKFMGKDWDKALPSREAFEQIIRVLKPGALAFVMSSPRQDLLWRMLALLEGVGFELTQSYIDWIYKTGFPKAYDVSKGIDKKIGQVNQSIIDIKQKLIELFDKSGKTRNQIDEECSFRACNYLSLHKEGKQPDPWTHILPSFKKWLIIKQVIGYSNTDLDSIFREAERIIIGKKERDRNFPLPHSYDGKRIDLDITASTQEISQKWSGWKSQTGLKPAHEPILMVNKPFSESTIVDNVLKWGTGAINVDSCRIPFQNEEERSSTPSRLGFNQNLNDDGWKGIGKEIITDLSTKGRFPANLLVSDKALDTGELSKSGTLEPHHNILGDGEGNKSGEIYGTFIRVPAGNHTTYGDIGDQSRYFDLDAWARQHGLDFDYSVNYDKQLASLWYNFIEDHNGNVDDGYLFDCLKETLKILRPDLYDLSCLLYDVPKPDNKERDYGLKGRKAIPKSKFNLNDGSKDERFDGAVSLPRRNIHPTVKPIKLMAYLIELGCPPDGVVLDPFVGSGTTCIAAKKLVRKYVGIEINPEYVALAEARIRAYPVPFDWFNEESK